MRWTELSTGSSFFRLWHGTMPALFKRFLEHIFRPVIAVDYRKNAFPERCFPVVLPACRDQGNAGASVSLASSAFSVMG
jgi:hypothetical protein